VSHRADPLNDVAWTSLIRGDIAAARPAARQLLALRAGAADSDELHTCGAVELAAGDISEAGAHFGLALSRAVGARRALDQLEGLALVAAARDDPAAALRLFAATAEQRERLHLPNSGWWAAQVGSAHEAVRRTLAAADAEAATAEGRALSLDQLIRYGLDGDLRASRPPDSLLTSRETAVARLLVTGHTTRQIAARLGIGTRAVDGHVARARAKLGLSRRAQLAVWAAEHLP
jgi:DNA-binding CsgD family transcriptional regulator